MAEERSATGTEEGTQGQKRGHGSCRQQRDKSCGRGERAGPALHDLRSARHTAAACRVTNCGNLESSLLSSPPAPRLSQHNNAPSVRRASFHLPCPPRASIASVLPSSVVRSPFIHYPITKYLFRPDPPCPALSLNSRVTY